MKNKIETEVTSKKQANELIAKIKAMTFEKELPKSWEELKEIKGVYIDSYCGFTLEDEYLTTDKNKNLFATKKQAESSLAKAQLSQLMKVYNDGWVADWGDDSMKYCFVRVYNEIHFEVFCNSYRFLAFKEFKTRDLFYENHIELIKTYFEL